MLHHSIVFFGIAAVVLTVSLKARYRLGKDKFNRTNAAGVLQYNSYDEVLTHRFVGGFINVASRFGIVLGLGAAFSGFVYLFRG